MKQVTIRAFEVDDFDKLKAVVEKKYLLIKNHFFILKQKDEKIIEYLKEKNLKYVINNEIYTDKKEIKVVEKIEKVYIKETKTKIYDKIIRSGEELNLDINAIFLNRINAGAKITTTAGIEIYQKNEGLIVADGDYLIVKENRGTIIYKGEDIGIVDKLTIFTPQFKKVLQ